MQNPKRRFAVLGMSVLAIGLVAVACGGGDNGTDTIVNNQGGSSGTSGTAGTSGTSGTGGSGTSGTGGSGTSGTSGSAGTSGSGTSGSAGSGTAGTGTSGSAGSGTSGTAGSGTAGTGTSGAGGGGNCTTWLVTYDLKSPNTYFDIRDTPFSGAGDQKNTCEEPYTADNHIGPGTMVLRFEDDGGKPKVAGKVSLVSYDMKMDFIVTATALGTKTTVTSKLNASSGPEVCGNANGTIEGGWAPSSLNNYHTTGTITCSGTGCFQVQQGPKDTNETIPINKFSFTNGIDNFSMPETKIQDDSKSKSWLAWTGAKTKQEMSTECFCP
jgi:hypothetical protein